MEQIVLIANDNSSFHVDLATARRLFEYFRFSTATASITGSSYSLPFPSEPISRLTEALHLSALYLEKSVVKHAAYPILMDIDKALIDFLQPVNPAIYTFYRAGELSTMEAMGSVFPRAKYPFGYDIDLSHYSEAVANYCLVLGVEGVTWLPPVPVNSINLWNQIMIRYVHDGLQGVEEYLESTQLLLKWDPWSPRSDLKDEIFDMVLEKATDCITSCTSPSDLLRMASATIPDKLFSPLATTDSLPWGLVLDEERHDRVSFHVMRYLPVRHTVHVESDSDSYSD